MSNVCTYFVKLPSGSDIGLFLRDFTVKYDLKAAFLISCTGKVSNATIRLAEATAGFKPVKEVTGLAEIESLVGTLSAGSHLHISLTDSNGKVTGGHIFGPLIASGTVDVILGECMGLIFQRMYDEKTGYKELVVKHRDTSPNDIPENNLGAVLTQHPNTSTLLDKLHVATYFNHSELTAFTLRLEPGQDIISNLTNLVTKENLRAAFIMSCVGSVTKAKISLVHNPKTETANMEGHFEIVSLVGRLAITRTHLHISLSDKEGHVIDGDVIDSLVVFTTAELVIGECTDDHLIRKLDPKTSYLELLIKKNKQSYLTL